MCKKPSYKYVIKKDESKKAVLNPDSPLPQGDKKNQQEEAASPQLLLSRIEWLAAYFDRLNFGKYVEILHKPRRVFVINFIAGVARGFGFAVGFTLLGFLTVYLIGRLNLLNLPLIGDFIAELLRYVEMSQGARV